MLLFLALFAIVGGALAFKAKYTTSIASQEQYYSMEQKRAQILQGLHRLANYL